jgi:hypothetical protein
MGKNDFNQQGQHVENQYNAGGSINFFDRKPSRVEISKEIAETELKILKLKEAITASANEWGDVSQVRRYILTGKPVDKSPEQKRLADKLWDEGQRMLKEKNILETYLAELKQALDSQP